MKDFFYKYFIIYISIFLLYFLNASYSELFNIDRDLSYKNEILLFSLFTIVQAFLVLMLYYIFFNFIYRIKLKNKVIYFLILFITFIYMVFYHITEIDNLLIYLLFYMFWIWWYWYYLKHIKKK